MIIGARHVERIRTFEAEHDPILIVYGHGVEPSPVTAERVQPVSRRYFQVVKPGYAVELIEFAAYDRPEFTRNTPSRFAVAAVPDGPRRIIRERPDHRTIVRFLRDAR